MLENIVCNLIGDIYGTGLRMESCEVGLFGGILSLSVGMSKQVEESGAAGVWQMNYADIQVHGQE